MKTTFEIIVKIHVGVNNYTKLREVITDIEDTLKIDGYMIHDSDYNEIDYENVDDHGIAQR